MEQTNRGRRLVRGGGSSIYLRDEERVILEAVASHDGQRATAMIAALIRDAANERGIDSAALVAAMPHGIDSQSVDVREAHQ